MKVVIKFGGTSIATVKDIKNVAKIVSTLSKKNKLVVVCSAVDEVTDELIKISNEIKKENKKEANRTLARISQKHKQFATHLITNSKIQKSKKQSPEDYSKTFAKLIFEGKINSGMRLLDESPSAGVLTFSQAVIDDLKSKHPAPEPANELVLIQGEIPFVDAVLFDSISEESVMKAAINTKVAAGPSGLDALGWRHILVSRNYGEHGKALREAITKLPKSLCTKNEESENSLEAYLSIDYTR